MATVNLHKLKGAVSVYSRGDNRPLQVDEAMAEIARGRMGNLDFYLNKASGRIQLTSGKVRVLAKHPELSGTSLTSGEFKVMLRRQAAKDVKRAVDRTLAGSMFYPAASLDAGTVSEVLGIFPKIRDVHLVDPGYKGLYSINDFYFTDFAKNCGFDKAERPVVEGVFGGGGKLVVSASGGKRDARFHFYAEDVLNLTPKSISGVAGVSVVNYPGHDGKLAYSPEFYRTVDKLTNYGGYVFVRNAKLPPKDMKELALTAKTEMTDPGSELFVSREDWAVYRRVR